MGRSRIGRPAGWRLAVVGPATVLMMNYAQFAFGDLPALSTPPDKGPFGGAWDGWDDRSIGSCAR